MIFDEHEVQYYLPTEDVKLADDNYYRGYTILLPNG